MQTHPLLIKLWVHALLADGHATTVPDELAGAIASSWTLRPARA